MARKKTKAAQFRESIQKVQKEGSLQKQKLKDAVEDIRKVFSETKEGFKLEIRKIKADGLKEVEKVKKGYATKIAKSMNDNEQVKELYALEKEETDAMKKQLSKSIDVFREESNKKLKQLKVEIKTLKYVRKQESAKINEEVKQKIIPIKEDLKAFNEAQNKLSVREFLVKNGVPYKEFSKFEDAPNKLEAIKFFMKNTYEIPDDYSIFEDIETSKDLNAFKREISFYKQTLHSIKKALTGVKDASDLENKPMVKEAFVKEANKLFSKSFSLKPSMQGKEVDEAIVKVKDMLQKMSPVDIMKLMESSDTSYGVSNYKDFEKFLKASESTFGVKEYQVKQLIKDHPDLEYEFSKLFMEGSKLNLDFSDPQSKELLFKIDNRVDIAHYMMQKIASDAGLDPEQFSKEHFDFKVAEMIVSAHPDEVKGISVDELTEENAIDYIGNHILEMHQKEVGGMYSNEFVDTMKSAVENGGTAEDLYSAFEKYVFHADEHAVSQEAEAIFPGGIDPGV